MKLNFISTAILFSLLMVGCSSDDTTTDQLTGSGSISIKYDNGYNGNDLIIGASNSSNVNGENLTITRLSYILSNFRLVNSTGEEYVFPKDESYFVISQEADLDNVVLPEIPAGEYTTLKFGVGVDQEKYLQGAEGQGDFLALAESHHMMWSWQAGYKFLNFELLSAAIDIIYHALSKCFVKRSQSFLKVSSSSSPLLKSLTVALLRSKSEKQFPNLELDKNSKRVYA